MHNARACYLADAIDTVIDGDFTPYIPKKRIEVFAPDELVEIIFDTLMATANTHQHGEGKVYVIDVSKCGKINTGGRKDEQVPETPE